MRRMRRFLRAIPVVLLLCVATAIASPAQTFTVLVNFNGTNGANPAAPLVQGVDGNYYGTTWDGGAHRLGTVFRITPGGALTSLYSFGGSDGANPQEGGLILASDGNFYGATIQGGVNNHNCSYEGGFGCGTIFKITPGGRLTTLYKFASTDGSAPFAGLVQAQNGNFYGSTTWGGANQNGSICVNGPLVGCGTIFEVTRGGTLTTLYNFCAIVNCTDGALPSGSLVHATDGNFYGTTLYGGSYGYGTVFKITPAGTLTTLYSFANSTDGRVPYAGLVQAKNGNFYGAAIAGGANYNSNCVSGCGTIFKITPGGVLTTLHSFDFSDGAAPYVRLIQATDANLYGTTYTGGDYGDGTVFKITLGGVLTTLHSFNGTDGSNSENRNGALVQGTDGNLYGTAYGGGAYGCGTAFSLSVGLGPFVETLPTSGKVGAAVRILGTNLTGATRVSFNGAAAPFEVLLPSEIVALVPSRASTGKVRVRTPGGTLLSNVPFRVP